MPYSTPLDVHVDHPVPFIDSQTLERRLRHQAGIVDHDVDTPVCLHRAVDELLHLLAVDDVGRDGERLSATAGEFVRQRLDAIGTPRTQHYRGTLRR